MREVKSSFTLHAKNRAHERVGLTTAQIAELIDNGLTVLVGTENGTKRTHHLFYSQPDQQCFVAVQDERNKEVITILPLDYHANKAWNISVEAQRKAKDLVNPPEDLGDLSLSLRPRMTFAVTAIVDYMKRTARSVKIGVMSADPFNGKVRLAKESHEFRDYIKRKIREHIPDFDGAQQVLVVVKRPGTMRNVSFEL